MTDKAQNTDVKCNDLPVIAPMMRGGAGWCDLRCPQAMRPPAPATVVNCQLDGEPRYSNWLCPVWATRTAARLVAAEAQLKKWESQDAHEGMDCYLTTKRLQAVEAWAEEAASVLELAMGVPDNTIQIMRQEGLKIEDIEDPMQKQAFTIHTEACEIANKAEALLDTYPGKDGQ